MSTPTAPPRSTLLSRRSLTRRGAGALTGLAVLLLAACGSTGSTGSTPSSASGSAKSFELIVPGTITAGTQPEQVPFNYTGADGKPTGFAIDLANEASKRLGLKVDYKFTNLQGILTGITAGKYDVAFAGLGATAERKKSVDFIKPYYWSYVALLTPSGSPANTKDDFSGKRVGVISGSVQETFAKKNMTSATLIQFKDQTSALGQLLTGGIDSFAVGGPDAEGHAKEHKGSFKIIEAGPSLQGTAFAVRKGNTALVTALDDTIDAMIEDGTYKQLYDKYFIRPISPLLVEQRPKLAKYAAPSANASAGSSASGASPSKTP